MAPSPPSSSEAAHNNDDRARGERAIADRIDEAIEIMQTSRGDGNAQWEKRKKAMRLLRSIAFRCLLEVAEDGKVEAELRVRACAMLLQNTGKG